MNEINKTHKDITQVEPIERCIYCPECNKIRLFAYITIGRGNTLSAVNGWFCEHERKLLGLIHE